MSLTKLGKYIELSDLRNEANMLGPEAVVGLSTQKHFITTKADLTGVDLTSYKIFPSGFFGYVPDTSRRGNKVSLAYNKTKETFLLSAISVVFKVVDTENLLSDYLYMYFNRPEFDRYARFNSWGSARETFSWEDMCDIDIELPSIETQQKYVDMYNAILSNQKAYEAGLNDLKLVCDGYIENLKRQLPLVKIGIYITQSDSRNEQGLTIEFVRGLATSKEMIATKADMQGVDLENYKIVPPGYIAYVPDTSRRGGKMSLGFNDSSETFLVSSISSVFCTDKSKLLPEYLVLFFCRAEFDRYARFHSWGSARETFDWQEMCDVEIPIPDIKTQQAIADIYRVRKERQKINERLKDSIKNICPVLIRGSLEEAQ